MNQPKDRELSSIEKAGHAALYPFFSGQAPKLMVKAALEAFALCAVLFALHCGIDRAFPFRACNTLCLRESVECCLSASGFLIWIFLATAFTWVWTYISCSLKKQRLVSTALMNSIVMIALLVIWYFTEWSVATLLSLELLVFLAIYFGYLSAVRRGKHSS